jgi:hypothetical protein
VVDENFQRLIKRRMRITLGKIAQQVGQGRQAVERQRGAHEMGGPQTEPLYLIGPQVLVEPGAPSGLNTVARLQDRLQHLGAAAMDQAHMSAMLARHQLEDNARFAVLADTDHDAFIGPLHSFRQLSGTRV